MSLEPNNYDPIQNVFCNYLKIKKDYDESEGDDESKSDDFADGILACDEQILYLNTHIEDNIYLDDNFNLIPNIRYTVDRRGEPTTILLDIYSRYLTPIFTSNLKEGNDSRFRLINSLTSIDVKRLNYYDRYIITFAVTAKFIALHNKKILMNEMKDLLRFIVIKLYNCYNRINVTERIKSALKGGALYLSTDEDMKKIEGQIIVLYNLYITNCLSIEDLTNKYNPTPHSVVVNLSNIFVALLLSGAILGAVTAAVAVPPAGAIALGATASAVGMCYTQHRGKFQSSYCTSADTNEIIKKLYKEFGLTVGDCDDCAKNILNSQLRPRYNEIQDKIDQFVRKVNIKYDKYNRIFDFIIENNTTFLPPNKCDPIPLPLPLNEVDSLIKGYLDILRTVVETPNNTWAQNTDYTNAIDGIIQNFPGQTCSRPTRKAELRSLINNIETRQGTDLLNYVKLGLLCRDPSVEVGGKKSRKTKNRKTKSKKMRKMRKRKTQKRSRK